MAMRINRLDQVLVIVQYMYASSFLYFRTYIYNTQYTHTHMMQFSSVLVVMMMTVSIASCTLVDTTLTFGAFNIQIFGVCDMYILSISGYQDVEHNCYAHVG